MKKISMVYMVVGVKYLGSLGATTVKFNHQFVELSPEVIDEMIVLVMAVEVKMYENAWSFVEQFMEVLQT